MSEISTPMGSVAISARPVREMMVSISSGNASVNALSTRPVAAMDSSRDTEGGRIACMAMAPSSRVGMNSAPMVAASRPPAPMAPMARQMTSVLKRSATLRTGSYRRRETRARMGSFSDKPR